LKPTVTHILTEQPTKDEGPEPLAASRRHHTDSKHLLKKLSRIAQRVSGVGCINLNLNLSIAPPGLLSFFRFFPALTRRATEFRPSGAPYTFSTHLLQAPTLNTYSRIPASRIPYPATRNACRVSGVGCLNRNLNLNLNPTIAPPGLLFLFASSRRLRAGLQNSAPPGLHTLSLHTYSKHLLQTLTQEFPHPVSRIPQRATRVGCRVH